MNAETARFESLTDDQLLAETRRLVACERTATAAVLRSLMEIDSRQLYLREGCASLFTYCTQVLHLAEGAAYNRLEDARAARRFPEVLVAVEAGFLTLASVRLLSPHFTVDNHRELIDRARHKSKRDVELLVAAVAPRQPVATLVRRLADKPVSAASTEQSLMRPEAPEIAAPTDPAPECAGAATAAFTETRPTDTYPASRPVSNVKPLSPSCYRLQVTLSEEAACQTASPTGFAASRDSEGRRRRRARSRADAARERFGTSPLGGHAGAALFSRIRWPRPICSGGCEASGVEA